MSLKKDSYYEELESKGYYNTIDKRSKDYREYKQWKANKIDVEYEEIKSNIEKNNSSRVGLGDVVEKITEATGIKKVVKSVVGEDCGCDERKENFNKISLWRRRKVRCISKEDYRWFKDFTKGRVTRYNAEQKRRLTSIYNHIFRTNKEVSSCPPCLNNLVKNISDYIKVWDSK
ncbi:MAG: hypothetical protein HRU18_11250 [Pseudoalteromonas sp.]|uniref:hypothetical protein n=1 Tax=Pseudoalteromonas sp. TaxID=53249 RepID=UPI001D43B9B4|nr:hypothetical protein [Pseudoalteromonas sp.]NRA78776.1 hypothetical protein [Pseudoalteromonas sp.]